MKTIELIASIATIIAVPLTLITYLCAKQRENTLRQIIEKQRKQHSRNSYFENIVKMVADLRKRQGVKL